MDKRPKPREKWESVIKGSRRTFKPEDYQDILRKLNIPFTDETIKKIIDIQSQYCDEIPLIDERPLMGEVCAMLTKLIHHGKKYEEWLNKIDGESLLKMAVAMHDKNLMDDIDMRGRIDQSLEDVIHITGTAALVIKNWQKSPKERRGGPRFKHAIREYIKRLAQLFEQATGKRATVTIKSKKYKEENVRNLLCPNYEVCLDIAAHGDFVFSCIECDEKTIISKEKARKKSYTYSGKFFDFVSFCINKIPNHPPITDATLAKYIKELPCPSHTTVKKS